MYLVSPRMEGLYAALEGDPELERFVEERGVRWTGSVPLTTDDWPYLYLERRRIPSLHLWVSALLAAGLLGLRVALFRRGQRLDLAFFFLGAAFLLLEFQNISKAALLFGSTWLVNAFIITGILLLVLAANAYARRRPPGELRRWFAALLLSVLALYFLPLEPLNALPVAPRAAVAALGLNLPIFFSGVLFVTLFARAEERSAALGSNLIGAAFGGLLESVSYLAGVKALLLLVFALYALAFAAWRRSARLPAAALRRAAGGAAPRSPAGAAAPRSRRPRSGGAAGRAGAGGGRRSPARAGGRPARRWRPPGSAR
jgi:hypothetical protein